MPNVPAYVWFDLEYTDLDLDKASILQVACIVTRPDLTRILPVERDVNVPVRLDASAACSPWVREHLGDLLAACRSERAVALEEADRLCARAIDDAAAGPTDDTDLRPVLAGNTVYADMVLARKFMPELTRRVHYRLLDVSAFKIEWLRREGVEAFDKDDAEQVRRWVPGDPSELAGRPHDAMYDILASMAELAFYRDRLLRPREG